MATVRESCQWFNYCRTMTAATELHHPPISDVAITDVLFALSDPARLALARQLVDGPMDMAACSATGGPVPKATKSHQLKVLREAGVVRNVAKGRGRLLSLRRDELDAVFPGLLDSVLGTR
ncbi:helix-turn-helix domain-containing protein [Streptomyces rhizosphaericus]|uniref:Helix-turn-helix domain-containing protein n=2 Tax=Streptomyces rhizosphaericus TaxID=114699 RepID=A0ABP4DZ96_9ACTN